MRKKEPREEKRRHVFFFFRPLLQKEEKERDRKTYSNGNINGIQCREEMKRRRLVCIFIHVNNQCETRRVLLFRAKSFDYRPTADWVRFSNARSKKEFKDFLGESIRLRWRSGEMSRGSKNFSIMYSEQIDQREWINWRGKSAWNHLSPIRNHLSSGLDRSDRSFFFFFFFAQFCPEDISLKCVCFDSHTCPNGNQALISESTFD